MITNYISVFIFQFIFNILKVLEIKHIANHKLKELLTVTVWLSLIALLTTWFTISQLLVGDWLVVIFYLAGSVAGKWFVMTKSMYKIFNFKRLINRK